MKLISAIKNVMKSKKTEPAPRKTLAEQIEAESHGWYDKPWALQKVIHGEKLHEIARLNGKLTMAGVQGLDEKKPEEVAICEEVFAMLEYIIFRAPKVMDALLTMRINDLKGQIAVAQNKAEKVLRATGKEATA